MRRIDLVVALLCAIVPLVALARRVHVAYPIVLVLAGLVLGFVPGLPHIELPPQTVLLVFLPPLLYSEALKAPAGTMRADSGLIRTLVIGLVIATATSVAIVAHALIANLPWAAAFVLGAIVAPTDAVAFAPIAGRLGVPHRTIALVEAEGLLNDASALVIYAVAVEAVVSGTFALRTAVLSFAVSCASAIALGLLLGIVVRYLWLRIRDSDLQLAVSVLAPFAAYLPAHAFGISGVLAVVTLGLYLNRHATEGLTPVARQSSTSFWEFTTFLMNTLIFLLVGLQLHPVLTRLSVYSRLHIVVLALTIAVTVLAVRAAWLFGQPYVLRLRHRIADREGDEWKHRLIATWAGFRGGVSLAAALAIPNAVASGADFPRRQLIIFLTFGVIFFTLVGQGSTLPWLIRRLRLPSDRHETAAERAALRRASEVALRRLETLERSARAGDDALELLRRRYLNRTRGLAVSERNGSAAPASGRAYAALARELLELQRAELFAMRSRGEIETAVLMRVEAIFDYEEIELDHLAELDATAKDDAALTE